MTRLQVPNKMLLNPALSLLAAPSVAGSLTMQVNGLERVRIDSEARGRTGISGPTDVALNGNAYLDAANWVRYDTTNPLGHFVIGRGTMTFYTAPAGTGAPPWSNKFHVDSDGMVRVSDRLNVGSAATAYQAGDIATSRNATPGAGTVYFGNTSGKYLHYDGTQFSLVGGTLQMGGNDLNCRWLSVSDGSNGVVYARNGDLYLRAATGSNLIRMDTATCVAVTGRLTVGGYDPAWPFCVAGNGIASGRFYQQNNGGAYCIDITDCSTSAVGNKIVQRSAEGYIYGNYINLTADVPGGTPAYVAGQNGDGFLRWYPKSSVTGALRTYGYFGGAGCPGGGTINRTTGINHNGIPVTHDGTSVYVQRTGVYVIYAKSGSGDNSWDTGRYQEMRIMTTRGNATGGVTHTPLGNNGSHVHQYYAINLNAGDQVYFQQYQNSGYTVNYDAGFWDMWYFASG